MARVYKWTMEIYVSENEVRDTLDLDENVEITDEMYRQTADTLFDWDMGEYDYQGYEEL